ncbi:MAG: hypothetical protein M3R00_07430 [Pseudomonadota bacterium]|nr:hypothetical protein [Pseudomonadota bacterium]
MQEHINKQTQRLQSIEQAAKQKRIESILNDLACNPLSFSDFPIVKAFDEYRSCECLKAWDYINEKVLSPSSKTLHFYIAQQFALVKKSTNIT